MPLMPRIAELSDGAVTVEDMLAHALACKTKSAAVSD